MIADNVNLDPIGNSNIEIKMTAVGLIKAEYKSAKLYELLTKLKEQSGKLNTTPEIFGLLGNESENIGRRFELDTTIGAVDPQNFPDWSVTCEVVRKGNPDISLKTVTDKSKFSNSNLADSKIIINFS